jgi:hypothetical protein
MLAKDAPFRRICRYPLPTQKSWENSQKFVCGLVALAAEIRYRDESFFKTGEPGAGANRSPTVLATGESRIIRLAPGSGAHEEASRTKFR